MTRIRSERWQGPSRERGARGVSLVELMIALALSAFLLLGLAQVFAASRAAYQTAEALGRVQENGRVGLDLISRDLRMGGHMGCAASQSRATQPSGSAPPFYTRLSTARVTPGGAPFLFRFDVPIQGFEYTAEDTSPTATLDLRANPDPPAAADRSEWTPNLPPVLATPLFAGANDPVVGSDIIIVRYFSAEAAVVTNALSSTASPLTINFANAPGDFFASGSPAVVAGSGIFAATDCNQITVFQPQVTPANAAAGNLTVSWPNGLNQNSWGPPAGGDTAVSDEVYADTGTRIHRGEVVVYYVGTTPRGPSLFRMRFRATPGTATITSLGAEELAEGVENLQLVFARDARSDRPALPITGFVPDGFADIEETAEDLTTTGTPSAAQIASRWRNVGRVRFGMLIRSVEYAASVNEGVDTDYVVAGTIVTPPPDGRMRQVYETAVMQRNQAFGN
jgi:type IV pilus assembly protein PilW